MKLFCEGLRGSPPTAAPHEAASASTSIDRQIASLGSPAASQNEATEAAQCYESIPSSWQGHTPAPSQTTTLTSPRYQGDWTSEMANVLAIAFVFTAVDLVVIERASNVTAALFLSLLHLAIVLLFHITGKRLMAIHCGIAGPLATAVTFSFLYLI
ncbi:MAG: hypothetical protein WBA10_04175 [Elainellaceae cyanobacterium]